MVNSSYPLPSPIVTSDPQWLGGEPCFTGRRVAIKTLFDYLKAGQTLERFLEDFPSVSHDHAVAVIELANHVIAARESAE